jgi:hypothetical protein
MQQLNPMVLSKQLYSNVYNSLIAVILLFMHNSITKYVFLLFIYICQLDMAKGQNRQYTNQSVLANGAVYKIAINQEGVFKIDIALLQSLGVNTTNLSSQQIQVFGNGGQPLPEDNALFRIDDLTPINIQIEDGGDGVLNNNDRILFYAQGPDVWQKDSINKRFTFFKNIYSNKSFYYIKIGNANSTTISTINNLPTSSFIINDNQEALVIKKELFNVLSSGKLWLGDIINNSTINNISYNLNFSATPIAPVYLNINGFARSLNTPCQWRLNANGALVNNIFFNAVNGSYLSNYASNSIFATTFNLQQNNQLNIALLGGSSNVQSWVNQIEAHAIIPLQLNANGFTKIINWKGVGQQAFGTYELNNADAQTQIWEITQANQPKKIAYNLINSKAQFTRPLNQLNSFVAFNNAGIKTPEAIGKINNQNLHGTATPALLILCPKTMETAAQKIATYHSNKQQLNAAIVNIEEVYEEFGSGTKDVTAIRDFIKMHYDRGLNTATPLRYVLLLGDATYDYKNIAQTTSNVVPAWQSPNSIDPLNTYVTDDFFGLLNDNENINNPLPSDNIDVAIGRIPAKNLEEANHVIEKIYAYNDSVSFGDWRTNTVFVADDEDFNLHLNDAEYLINNNLSNKNYLNTKKIYLDAFTQTVQGGTASYPAAVTAIANAFNKGAAIWNYSGHGSYNRLTAESTVELATTNWNTKNKWPIMVTATCDFAPYDNPAQFSLGEDLLLRKNNGAIALLTTTRLVFASSNKIINNNFLEDLVQNPSTLGNAVKNAKNKSILQGETVNSRKFVLLGDPALIPALPQQKVKTVAINQNNFVVGADTLKALNNYLIKGAVYNNNTINTNFNGKALITIYDKNQTIQTKANDNSSLVQNFTVTENVVYRGNTTVTNGVFEINIVLPADINLNVGWGAIKYYAFSNNIDAAGADSILIGSLGNNAVNDNKGPAIVLSVNGLKARNGSKVLNPVKLSALLTDETGINLSTAGVGHEIVAQLNQANNKIILNDNFSAFTNGTIGGSIEYVLGNLPLGKNTISLKAWDVFNNSNTASLNFEVVAPNKEEIFELYNYPNPFSQKTTLVASHNLAGNDIKINLLVYNALGQKIHFETRTIKNQENRLCVWELKWPTTLEHFKGPLLYSVTLTNETGKSVQLSGKMVKF